LEIWRSDKAYKETLDKRVGWRIVGGFMDNKIVYAIIIGVVLFVAGTSLGIFTNQEGLQLLLFFLTSFVIGFVATGVKRGFLLAFAISFLYLIISIAIRSQGTLDAMSNTNVLFAVILLTLINSAISGVLGALGGFLGKRILK